MLKLDLTGKQAEVLQRAISERKYEIDHFIRKEEGAYKSEEFREKAIEEVSILEDIQKKLITEQ